MIGLLFPIIKKVRRLSTNALPIISYWGAIFTSGLLIYITWSVKHRGSSNLTPSTMNIDEYLQSISDLTWVLILLSAALSFPDNKYKQRSKTIILVVSFFVVDITCSGNQAMVPFRMAIHMSCNYSISRRTYLKINRDCKRVLGLMSPKRKEEYARKHCFDIHISFYHLVALQVIIVILSIIYKRLFVKFVKLIAPVLSKWHETPYFLVVTINVATVILIIPSLELCDKVAVSLPFRDVFGENISNTTIKDLKELYPEGFDTYRFQYLLHDTLRKGERIESIQKLISIFPNNIMKVKDDKGETPFLLACQYSSAEVVEYLIGIDNDLLDSRDDKGDTALHNACRERNYKVVKYLLNKHMGLATKRNTEGYLPVYLLAARYHLLCGMGDGSNKTSGSRSGRKSFVSLGFGCIPNFTFNSGSPSRVGYGSEAYIAYNKKCMNLSTQLFPIPSVDREHIETIWRLLLAYPEDMS